MKRRNVPGISWIHHWFLSREAREARRTNSPTAHPNSQKYARCEWKCIAFIGIDDWGKFATKQYVETLHTMSLQRAETHSNECNALQRAAGRLRD